MRWTRTAAKALAANLDQGAAAKTEAARSGRAFAADLTNDDRSRQQAAAAANILLGQAQDMRADAAAIRDGVSPAELGYTN
ncbi:hypothetical protein ACWC9T_21100 [Kitasatospora sp. NPDC001159]